MEFVVHAGFVVAFVGGFDVGVGDSVDGLGLELVAVFVDVEVPEGHSRERGVGIYFSKIMRARKSVFILKISQPTK